jgi:hypothetical protein
MGVCLQCQGALRLTLNEEGHNTATCLPMADWVLDKVVKPLIVKFCQYEKKGGHVLKINYVIATYCK